MFGKHDHLADASRKIRYYDNTFLARFASPVFHDPDGIICRYRLAGLEPAFTETRLREARYSSLPARKYTFQVACGSAGLGLSALASHTFTAITPCAGSWVARSS